MKSFKNHLSFLIPLFILLFSVEFAKVLDRGLAKYESKLSDDYSIVVVSKSNLSIKYLKSIDKSIDSIQEIDKSQYIKKLVNSGISQENLVSLKANLPDFYTIKFKDLPTKKHLELIKSKLIKLNNIQRVEIYKRAYERLHQFLILLSSASHVFTIFIAIISILLIIKQMEIWTYEHKNRMYIMTLFGAPYWLKSTPLYRLVSIDSLIASLLVSATFLYIPSIVDLDGINQDLGVDLQNFNFFEDTMFLLLLSIVISVVAVTITILKDQK
jgi:cell division transport system permease protein